MTPVCPISWAIIDSTLCQHLGHHSLSRQTDSTVRLLTPLPTACLDPASDALHPVPTLKVTSPGVSSKPGCPGAMRRAASTLAGRAPRRWVAGPLTPSPARGHGGGRRYSSQHHPGPIARLLQWKPADKVDDVVVNGFVRSVRSMKAHRFVSVGDGSSLAPLQALVETDQAQGCALLPPTCVSRLWPFADPASSAYPSGRLSASRAHG